MRVLLACDKFKGTLTAAEVTDVLSRPLVGRGHETLSLPIADGGDGTVAAALARGYTPHTLTVTDPLGEPVEATWASHDDTAVIEMAQASGLALLPDGPDATTALTATTRGTGEMIKAALDTGCSRIVLGIGGSATTDGGAGMLAALGVKLLDANGAPVPDGGVGLEQLVEVEMCDLDPRIESGHADFTLASDVMNPLLGEDGAAAVYGPQKGAGPAEVARLDAALAHYASLVPGGGVHLRHSGAGAAGGVGFAALAVLGCEGCADESASGADYVLDLLGFDAALASAEVVVTGEGRFDSQSLNGKGPGRVVEKARERGLPVLVVAGSSEFPADAAADLGLAGLVTMDSHAPVEECLTRPAEVLTKAAEDLAALVDRALTPSV
ncbi:glycerate kinase [Brevibacterium litoralis]|uniref:glycerate kinase n=1 Tax=Brevibacterium litoralis TaxID=3138935 RepID=UPI0032EADE0C